MAETHEQRAREIAAKQVEWLSDQNYQGEPLLHAIVCCDWVSRQRFINSVAKLIEPALAEVERETAKKCAEIAEAAFPAGCKGWRTAHNGGKAAAAEIRRKFGVEEMKTR